MVIIIYVIFSILTIAVGIAVLSFYFTYEELKHIDTINDELSWCEFLLYLWGIETVLHCSPC